MERINTLEQQQVVGNGDSGNKVNSDSASGVCYKALVEHWAEARIDGPVQAIAKYDDAAKQLITIGGFLQAGLVAVYSVLSRQQNLSMTKWQIGGIILFEVSLLAFLSSAAWVCSLQPEMEVAPVSALLRSIVEQPLARNSLIPMVDDWCEKFRTGIEDKRRWMLLAKVSFIVCCLTMSVLMLLPLYL